MLRAFQVSAAAAINNGYATFANISLFNHNTLTTMAVTPVIGRVTSVKCMEVRYGLNVLAHLTDFFYRGYGTQPSPMYVSTDMPCAIQQSIGFPTFARYRLVQARSNRRRPAAD